MERGREIHTITCSLLSHYSEYDLTKKCIRRVLYLLPKLKTENKEKRSNIHLTIHRLSIYKQTNCDNSEQLKYKHWTKISKENKPTIQDKKPTLFNIRSFSMHVKLSLLSLFLAICFSTSAVSCTTLDLTKPKTIKYRSRKLFLSSTFIFTSSPLKLCFLWIREGKEEGGGDHRTGNLGGGGGGGGVE